MAEETVVVTAPPPAGAVAASAAGSVVLPPAGSGTPPTFVLPDAYKDKPYLKGVDTLDKVYAMLDGAETKLGQRPAGIPDDKASPEEWQKFWTQMGRPESPDKYVFDYGKNADGTPKGPTDPDIDKALKTMLHEEGISAKQAAGLQKKFDTLAQGIIAKKGLAAQQLDQDFDKLGKEVYGAEYQKVMDRVLPLVKEFANPKLGVGVAKLNAEQLLIMSSVIDGMRAKFIKADSAPIVPGGGGGIGAGTADAMRAEARQLMTSPAYTNAFDPNHEATKTRINQLYQEASKIK